MLPSAYTVERSADGIAWTPIATVAAPSTTCSGSVQYHDEGLDPLATYYYRVTGDALASNIASITTSPPPIAVQPIGDASKAVFSYPAGACDDAGGCEQWADVIDAPFGGTFTTVGPRVDCGSDCGRYNVRPQYVYPAGHAVSLEIVPPEGYAVDSAFPNGIYQCGTNDSCNIGGAGWLTGQTAAGNNGLALLVLCSGYPINPTPSILASNVGAFAEVRLVTATDPHHAWIYFVRTGGFVPACTATTTTNTDTTATFRWGQLWTADIKARLIRRGKLVKKAHLGTMKFGHHRWSFRHRHGRYTVHICGTRLRRGSSSVHACITRHYRF